MQIPDGRGEFVGLVGGPVCGMLVEMIEAEHAAYLAFSYLGFVGPRKFSQLLKYFGTAQNAWRAPAGEYVNLGWKERQREILARMQTSFDGEKELKQLSDKAIKILTLSEETYPKNLKEISDPPYLLYVRGDLKPTDSLALAVVGSRRMTSYGRQVIEALLPELVEAGLTIVSGLAFGVDFLAQKTALAEGGRTLAVLASGVDLITPRTHEALGSLVVEQSRGALISELPPGTEPLPAFFPVRNRIISGLALGTLVVEAAEKSGTYYTVVSALEQGREVFAVPGSIFNPLSAGTGKLVREGAKLVLNAGDILAELNVETVRPQVEAAAVLPEDAEEKKLLEKMGDLEVHVDILVRASGLPAGQISALLTGLELKGLVKNLGGGMFRRVSAKG